MFPIDDTQFPKRRKFDIANIESPMWHFYARVVREPFKTTVPTSVQNTSPVASEARRCPEAEPFHPGPIQGRESFPLSHDCLVKDLASSRAHEVSFRATEMAEEIDPRGGINPLSVLTSSNGRPVPLPPPLNPVEAVGTLGGLGFDHCPAGKAADATCLQGWYGPLIDTRADSDVSRVCHDGSCEPFANQEAEFVLAVLAHRTAVPNNSRIQNRLANPEDEKPGTSLQFLPRGPAAVVLALDPALEEGGDSWSPPAEAGVQSQSGPPVGTRSAGWLGPVHKNTKADKGYRYELSALRTLRKKNEKHEGNQKRSWNPGQPPLNSGPRRVPLEVSFPSSLRFLIQPFLLCCPTSEKLNISHHHADTHPTCVPFILFFFISSRGQQFTYSSLCR